MTKKKIGELEGTPIVTGDKNYANEHEYYMTLNGDNTYQKLEQRTNGDQFRSVLGGSDSGSGCNCGGFKYNELPEPAQFRDPTEDDIAKFTLSHATLLAVLDLKDTIIPNQIICEESDLDYKHYQIFYITDFDSMSGNISSISYDGISNGEILSIKQYLSYLLDAEVTYLRLSQDGTMIGVIHEDSV